eukprot:gene12175-biopygen12426
MNERNDTGALRGQAGARAGFFPGSVTVLRRAAPRGGGAAARPVGAGAAGARLTAPPPPPSAKQPRRTRGVTPVWGRADAGLGPRAGCGGRRRGCLPRGAVRVLRPHTGVVEGAGLRGRARVECAPRVSLCAHVPARARQGEHRRRGVAGVSPGLSEFQSTAGMPIRFRSRHAAAAWNRNFPGANRAPGGGLYTILRPRAPAVQFLQNWKVRPPGCRRGVARNSPSWARHAPVAGAQQACVGPAPRRAEGRGPGGQPSGAGAVRAAHPCRCRQGADDVSPAPPRPPAEPNYDSDFQCTIRARGSRGLPALPPVDRRSTAGPCQVRIRVCWRASPYALPCAPKPFREHCGRRRTRGAAGRPPFSVRGHAAPCPI